MLNKRIVDFIKRKYYYFLNRNKYRYLSKSAVIQSLLRLDGAQNIHISKGVIVQKHTWLAAVPIYENEECILEIGEGSVIGHFNHIYSTKQIIIGKNVLTADKVYIADNQHVYDDVNTPILKQSVKQLSAIHIGDGSWIGENVCIIGASIGKNCVIGANSVVTKSIPDYCIAVGVPAKIIKKFNLNTKEWQKV